jgi:chromosome segregation ATPase
MTQTTDDRRFDGGDASRIEALEDDLDRLRIELANTEQDYDQTWQRLSARVAEVERLREALQQIRDGIFSGNQAASWARKALDA